MQNPGLTAGVFVCWAFAHGFRRRLRRDSVMHAARSATERTPANRGGRHASLIHAARGAFLLGISAASPAQAQELHIGFLAPRTGIFTQLGTDMVNGFQMYLDEHDGKLGGAKVTFIVEDDKGKPDVDVTMAKKLILQDKVDMIVGAVLGSSAYALAPVSNQEKMLFIGTITTADDLAQRQVDKYPYTVFSTWVSSQPNHALGQWACDQGYKRVSAIGTDYAFGYEQVGGFQKAFEDCGGKVVQKIWVPFGTKDFGPYHSGASRATSTPSSR